MAGRILNEAHAHVKHPVKRATIEGDRNSLPLRGAVRLITGHVYVTQRIILVGSVPELLSTPLVN